MRRASVKVLCLMLLWALGPFPASVPLLHALPTPLASSLDLGAYSYVVVDGLEATDTDYASQSDAVDPLGAAVSATASAQGQSITTGVSASASWADPSQGSVNFADAGWSTFNVIDPGVAAINVGNGFVYDFLADMSGEFSIDYEVTTTGTDLSGVLGFDLLVTDLTATDPVLNQPDIIGTGRVTASLSAGNAYRLQIRTQNNIVGSLGTRTAFMDGTFDFAIPVAPGPATVPEPNSLLLLGSGLAWIVTLVRRSAE